MKDIAIIIPVHDYSEEIEKLLKRAINSVPNNMEVRISCHKDNEKDLEWVKNRENTTIYISDNKKDFATLINQAVGNTTWFSILEFDDEYTPIWFNNVDKYIDFYPENSVFMPLTEIYNYENNTFECYGNEAPWASSFSDEIGYIDYKSLQDYFDFYLTGSVFNTNDWISSGGLKSSIKLSFWYEFLLRLTNLGKKVFVIPKVGYKHYLGRKNSIFDIYKQSVNQEESSWWFDLARQECFFKNDREKKYQK